MRPSPAAADQRAGAQGGLQRAGEVFGVPAVAQDGEGQARLLQRGLGVAVLDGQAQRRHVGVQQAGVARCASRLPAWPPRSRCGAARCAGRARWKRSAAGSRRRPARTAASRDGCSRPRVRRCPARPPWRACAPARRAAPRASWALRPATTRRPSCPVAPVMAMVMVCNGCSGGRRDCKMHSLLLRKYIHEGKYQTARQAGRQADRQGADARAAPATRRPARRGLPVARGAAARHQPLGRARADRAGDAHAPVLPNCGAPSAASASACWRRRCSGSRATGWCSASRTTWCRRTSSTG